MFLVQQTAWKFGAVADKFCRSDTMTRNLARARKAMTRSVRQPVPEKTRKEEKKKQEIRTKQKAHLTLHMRLRFSIARQERRKRILRHFWEPV